MKPDEAACMYSSRTCCTACKIVDTEPSADHSALKALCCTTLASEMKGDVKPASRQRMRGGS